MSYINFYYKHPYKKDEDDITEEKKVPAIENTEGIEICFITKDQFHLLGPRLRELEGIFISEKPIGRVHMRIPPSKIPDVERIYSGKLQDFSSFENPKLK